MSGIKIGDVWQQPTSIYVKIDGQWKILSSTSAKIDGVWKTTTFGSSPPKPTVSYVSTGLFALSTFDPSLTYVATLVSGSGTATLNTTNGRYTLSGADCRFRVDISYVPGSPTTSVYMERKKYSYSCRQVSYSCGCNCTAVCSGTCNQYGGGSCVQNGNCQCGCCSALGGGWGWGGCVWVACQTCQCCCNTVCDVLIDETINGYINSGSEWYKVI